MKEKEQTYSEFNASLLERSLSLMQKSIESAEAGKLDTTGLNSVAIQGVWICGLAQAAALIRIADAVERWEQKCKI